RSPCSSWTCSARPAGRPARRRPPSPAPRPSPAEGHAEGGPPRCRGRAALQHVPTDVSAVAAGLPRALVLLVDLDALLAELPPHPFGFGDLLLGDAHLLHGDLFLADRRPLLVPAGLLPLLPGPARAGAPLLPRPWLALAARRRP